MSTSTHSGPTNTTHTAEPYDAEDIREDLYSHKAKTLVVRITQPPTHHCDKSENIIPLGQ